MDNSKGMEITDFFVYIAIFFVAVFSYTKLGHFLDTHNFSYLLLFFTDIFIICGYYCLSKCKKIGLLFTLGGFLAFVIIQSMETQYGLFTSIFSAESLVTLVVLCAMIPKLKKLK